MDMVYISQTYPVNTPNAKYFIFKISFPKVITKLLLLYLNIRFHPPVSASFMLYKPYSLHYKYQMTFLTQRNVNHQGNIWS